MANNHHEAVEALLQERCIASAGRRLQRWLARLYDDALTGTALTVAQLDLLATLLDLGPGTRSIDVARAMGVERSTLSRSLARLTGKGFVKTEDGGDGRERYLSVTDLGMEAIAEAVPSWHEAQSAVRETLGNDFVGLLVDTRFRSSMEV